MLTPFTIGIRKQRIINTKAQDVSPFQHSTGTVHKPNAYFIIN